MVSIYTYKQKPFLSELGENKRRWLAGWLAGQLLSPLNGG
jgi:hypothetical protein